MLWSIRNSKIHGKGVFAVTDVKSGTDLGIAIKRINSMVPLRTTGLGAKVNHSTKPNVKLVKKTDGYHLVTTRAVKKDEEMAADYNAAPPFIKKPDKNWKKIGEHKMTPYEQGFMDKMAQAEENQPGLVTQLLTTLALLSGPAGAAHGALDPVGGQRLLSAGAEGLGAGLGGIGGGILGSLGGALAGHGLDYDPAAAAKIGAGIGIPTMAALGGGVGREILELLQGNAANVNRPQ